MLRFGRFGITNLVRVGIPLALLFAGDLWEEFFRKTISLTNIPVLLRWGGYFGFIAFCIIHRFLWYSPADSFIYFNF
jgi:hypothetical protein